MEQHCTDLSHPTHKYALDVVEGRIVAGPIVRAACKRHLDDLRDAPARGWVFSENLSGRIIRFFPGVLKLNGGEFEGKPFHLADAYQFIVGSIFGWINASTGYRRFRVAYVEIAKGNAKSPVAAGIGLYGLIADNEPRAEIFSAAAKKDQAMILFRDAVAAFEMSPALSARIKPSGKQPNVWNLYDEKTGSYFRPISSDEGQSGHRPHMGLVDELHEHKNSSVVNMMTAGQKTRKQPLVFIITNSGSDKTSVCGEYHDKAERIAFGMEKDDSFFAFVAGLDKDDDPFTDESCWIKANPLLGVTIQKQYIREQIAAATMPSKKSDVMRLNFCIWTAADNPFIDFNSWSASKAKYDLSIFAGRDDVSLGLDLSQVRDLTAAVFSAKKAGVIHWWAEFWIPEGVVAEKVKEDKVPYDHWIREGWVRATPGNTIDLGYVAKDLKELQKKHNFTMRSVPYDRWRIDDFKKACESVDFRIKDQLQEFGQGFKDMSPAVDEFERSLMDGKFRHPGNPCLDWCAANAVIISDPAGGRKLDKGSNQKKRIDGIIAGIMSHHATSLLPEQALPTIRWL